MRESEGIRESESRTLRISHAADRKLRGLSTRARSHAHAQSISNNYSGREG